MNKKVKKVWVDENNVYVETKDGLVASYSFSQWPRLSNATKAQREDFQLTYLGIYWPQIDEDLSFEGMFADAGYCEHTVNEDSVVYEKLDPSSHK